jgi:hypothetical protein
MLVLQRRLLSDISRAIRFFAHAGRWVLTLILPLVLMTLLNAQTNAREMQQIAKRFAPLLDFIERSVVENGHAPTDLSSYVSDHPLQSRFTYLYADERYMVQTRGGSIDIDGSTVYFNSTSNTWSRIHNDLLHAESRNSDALQYTKARKGLRAPKHP